MRHSDWHLHTLVGAYILDALNPQERHCFEEHLARCETCAQETREFRETAARLAVAAAQPPPAGMKHDVLAAAAATRQRPPLTPARRSPALLGRDVGRPARSDTIRRLRQPRLNLSRLRWRQLGALVALGAAIAVIGVFVAVDNTRSGGSPPTNAHIAAVLTAPDAITLTAAVRNGGTSTIVMSPSQGQLVFVASGLTPLPRSKCYMLWLLRPGGDMAASRLPPPIDNMTGPVIANGIHDHDHLGLSVEPAHGSSTPTTAMLIDVTL
jgi:anti-sigma factor RsiW